MTDAGWAEKKVDKHAKVNGTLWVGPAVDLLKAEHARSVRIVKREIQAHRRELDEAAEAGNVQAERLHIFAIAQLETVLTALQRGRGGKG